MRSDRIRLLKFVNAFALGGTERQFVALSERVAPEWFEVHLACHRRWGPLLPRVERLGVPLVEYPVRSLYRPEAWTWRLELFRYLRRHSMQIVHSYGFYPNIFAIPAARAAGVPLVVASIRDTGAGLTWLQRRVQRVACRLADCILVNARAVREWLVTEGYDAGKIHVIPNGIDASPSSGVGVGRLHEELGLAPSLPLVAVVSHLNPLKGLDCFLEAAAQVARRFPDVRFLLVGDRFQSKEGKISPERAYREHLAGRAGRLGLGGRVIFTGYRTDVPQILPDIAVSVLPSLSEGLSNTLLESMASGRPVVATRVGGTPEAVEDGVTGLLVPPGDAAALADAVVRLLADGELAARLGAAARRSVLERFSMERMVIETERLYVEELRRVSERALALTVSPRVGA